MNGIDTSNLYAEALKHNSNFLYGEVRGTRGLIDELMVMVEGLAKKKKKRRMASVGVETERTEEKMPEKVPEVTEEDDDGLSTDGERTEGEETDGEKTDGEKTDDGKGDEEEVEEQTMATTTGEDVQMGEE